MINQRATLISRLRDAHFFRISKLLGESFKSFQVLNPDEIKSLDDTETLSSKSGFIFFYPLEVIDGFTPTETGAIQIGLSNSLDLIGVESSSMSQRHFEERLSKYHYVIVDTRQAAKLVRASAPKTSVLEVPWGLDLSLSKIGPIRPNLRSRILLPRLSSSYYQPDRLIQACIQASLVVNNLQFTLVLDIDTENQLDSKFRISSNSHFRTIGPMEELSFISELERHDAVIMAPVTDGTSVTLLQSLNAGVIVLSSPTVGACEWITNNRTGFLARGDSVEDLSRLILDFSSSSEERIEEIARLGRRLVKIFGDYNTNMNMALEMIVSGELST
jgi:glycosyltransferase involved in cell wall biosynthesis